MRAGAGVSGVFAQVRAVVGADRPAAIGDDLFWIQPAESDQRNVSGRSDRHRAGCAEPRQSDRDVWDCEDDCGLHGVFDRRTDRYGASGEPVWIDFRVFSFSPGDIGDHAAGAAESFGAFFFVATAGRFAGDRGIWRAAFRAARSAAPVIVSLSFTQLLIHSFPPS